MRAINFNPLAMKKIVQNLAVICGLCLALEMSFVRGAEGEDKAIKDFVKIVSRIADLGEELIGNLIADLLDLEGAYFQNSMNL